MITNHLATLSKFFDLNSSKYEKMFIFNVGKDKPHMISFCETYNSTNLLKQPPYYKNPDNSKCKLESKLHVNFKTIVWLRLGHRIFIY